jgi:hypothetical protein
MNTWVKTWSLLLLTVGSLLAAPLLDEPVPVLTLKNGTVLKDARAKGFLTKVVLVKSADGAQTVAYELFPDEYQAALAGKRQAARVEQAKLDASARNQPQVRAVVPTAVPSVASDPELRDGCHVTMTGSRGGIAFVRIDNQTDHFVLLSPQQFAARAFSGEMFSGAHWVELDGEGRVATTLKGQQKLGAGGSVTLALALATPPDMPDNSVAAVVWK